MGIRYLKSGLTLFIKLNPIGPCSGFLDEILCTLEGQEAATLPEVKVGGRKKNLTFCFNPYILLCLRRRAGPKLAIFFQTSNFDLQ